MRTTGENERFRQRALATLRSISHDRSTHVVPVDGGAAYLNSNFPAAHDLNRLVVTGRHRPTALTEEADRILGGAGLGHRLIEMHDPAPGVEELDIDGYTLGRELLMAATRPAARTLPPLDVVELDLAERVAVAAHGWRREQPGWSGEIVEQISRRIGTVVPAARTTFLGVRDRGGSVVSRADLYVRDDVAQVEEVLTEPSRRGQGLASLLVTRAVEEARAAGARFVFLVTDAEGRPQDLYRSLGFTEIGRVTSLHRQHPADAGQ